MNSPFGDAPNQAHFGRPPIERSREYGMLTGTAAGLARYLDLDPTIVRVGFAALCLLGGAGIPLYVASWLLMPEEGHERSIAADVLDRSGFFDRHENCEQCNAARVQASHGDGPHDHRGNSGAPDAA